MHKETKCSTNERATRRLRGLVRMLWQVANGTYRVRNDLVNSKDPRDGNPAFKASSRSHKHNARKYPRQWRNNGKRTRNTRRRLCWGDYWHRAGRGKKRASSRQWRCGTALRFGKEVEKDEDESNSATQWKRSRQGACLHQMLACFTFCDVQSIVDISTPPQPALEESQTINTTR